MLWTSICQPTGSRSCRPASQLAAELPRSPPRDATKRRPQEITLLHERDKRDYCYHHESKRRQNQSDSERDRFKRKADVMTARREIYRRQRIVRAKDGHFRPVNVGVPSRIVNLADQKNAFPNGINFQLEIIGSS